ncbi:unnamed protein product [Wickerhamomyces anomalus]
MDASILSVHWHENSEPIYSVHFQPNREGNHSERLVTGGGDNNVRVTKHTQAVNVVRFDPKGEILATAGDDGTVLLWTLSESIVKEFGQEMDEDVQESWILRHACRSSTSEVYDLAWSPDSKYIITGSTDNVSRIYDVSNGQQICQIAEHNHFVQGVAWDPLGRYIATQSADRSVHIYLLNNVSSKDQTLSPTVFFKISRTELPTRSSTTSTLMGPPTPVKSHSEEDSTSRGSTVEIPESSAKPQATVASSASPTTASSSSMKSPSPSPLPAVRSQNAPLLNFNNLKNSMLYHTENLESFFRRLSFSPDGNFLFTPFRSGLNKPPIAHLPGLIRPALAIAFSPVFYELDKNEPKGPIFQLPYKMVYAVATQDSVIVYDTQHSAPLGTVSNIHYRTLTDLAFNSDGNSIVISAADGFCSLITFEPSTLGTKLSVDYKSLLPVSKENNEQNNKMQSPSQVKKRPNNGIMEITGLVKKKVKPEEPKTTEKVERISVQPSIKPEQEQKPKENEIITIEDNAEPQMIHTPPVKQVKRVAPILVEDKTSETPK